MKKTHTAIPPYLISMLRLIALSTAATLSFSGKAAAQSSVTLYGSFDVPVIYSNNQQVEGGKGGSSVQVGYVGQAPSRFGFQGSEDLGGGRSAVFQLEGYVFPGTGQMMQAGSIFNKYAYVGLKDASIGTLALGRQTDSYSDFLGLMVSSNTWATPYGSHFGDLDNLNQAFNFNNSIKFTSNTFGGVTVGGSYSLGGSATSFALNRGYSLAASYAYGPFTVAAGYLTLNNPLDAALGGSDGYIGDLACSNANAMYCSMQDAQTVRIAGVGGSMALDRLSVGLTYTHTQLQQTAFATADGGGKHHITADIAELNLTYNVQPDFQLGAAYIFNNIRPDGDASTQIHQVNLGATYLLSKRSAIYAVGIGQLSSGQGLGINAAGQSANLAQIPILGNSNSSRQFAVILGLRNSF
ncbi:putative porin [Paraburkholderia sp. BL27I4N3]|uniref:porin n=1 Tax=Paraburkholderia sp. BL27I4N3 TaxID=1938805 RepID=UPI000E392708|nr:porin [Paraburkholderia sp. BL27I4N3]REE06478.1 putative porin [Paraburkholderia sp. BL27I4N3]